MKRLIRQEKAQQRTDVRLERSIKLLTEQRTNGRRN